MRNVTLCVCKVDLREYFSLCCFVAALVRLGATSRVAYLDAAACALAGDEVLGGCTLKLQWQRDMQRPPPTLTTALF